jgi:hypothetical protein
MQLTDQQVKEILIAIAVNDNVTSFDTSETNGFKKGVNQLLSILKCEPIDIIEKIYEKHSRKLTGILFEQKLSGEQRVEKIVKYFDDIEVSSINKINS